MDSLWISLWISYKFPMVFLWFSDRLPTGLLWMSCWFSLDCVRISCMDFLCISFVLGFLSGFPMDFLWVSDRFPTGLLWNLLAYGLLSLSPTPLQLSPIGNPRVLHSQSLPEAPRASQTRPHHRPYRPPYRTGPHHKPEHLLAYGLLPLSDLLAYGLLPLYDRVYGLVFRV